MKNVQCVHHTVQIVIAQVNHSVHFLIHFWPLCPRQPDDEDDLSSGFLRSDPAGSENRQAVSQSVRLVSR